MPRARREVSESGFYHVTQRGNAHGLIFEADDHRRQFLRILRRYRDELGFRVIAWCLMDNHVHLVLDMRDQSLTEAMQRIEAAYVSYFARATGHEGHLFQGRFFSRPIETDEQLVATVDYVHKNPEAAGICPARSYRWSSVQEYLGKRYVVDVSLLIEMLGSVDALLAFPGDPANVVLTTSRGRCSGDAQALAIARKLYGDDVQAMLRSGESERRDAVIVALHRNGVSARQIARLSGMGRKSVASVLSRREP